MFPLLTLLPPEIPPPPNSSPLAYALYAMRNGFATADQVWLCRDSEETARNEKRRMDWETRFKVLGPRPEAEGLK